MNKFAQNILIGEDGTLSTSKIAALLGFMLIVHIWVDLRYLHLEYDASVLAFWLEVILIALGLRGVDRFSRYGLSEVVGKVGIGKKQAEANKTAESKPTAKANLKKEPKINEVPSAGNFQLHEFDSKDGAKMPAAVKRNIIKLIQHLEVIRETCGNKPITITSGYRSPEHNKAVGGAEKSLHMKGMAADFKVSGMRPAQVAQVLEKLINQGLIPDGGIGVYSRWVHYDYSKPRRWKG